MIQLWSTPYNWQSGTTPVSGGSVVLDADGVDDLGSLSLTSLTEEPGAELFYVAGSSLAIATLAVDLNGELYSGILGDATPVTVTVGSIVGAGSVLGAVGGTFIDTSTSDPGEHYFAGYGGSVTLNAAPAASSIFEFGPDANTIALDNIPVGSYGGTLEGLTPGDVLELPGSTVLSSSFGTGSFTITTNLGTYDFTNVQYDQPVTGETATHNTTTGLEDITFTAAACYRRGTRIRTPRGDVRIEDIKVGDEVATLSGTNRVVRWLGRRAIDCSAYADPMVVWPIRIKAEALAPSVPMRDLWLSPGHSLYIQGVLIQAEKLVNGATIVRAPQTRVEYWHVELDGHDIVLAEGAPSETYLDTGNRTAFENGGAYLEAYPDFKPKHWRETCVPLVMEGEPLVRARAQVFERAKALGYAITHDTDLHVMAHGERIDPVALGDDRWAFSIPATRGPIELCSRSFIPVGVNPSSYDERELGVCVGRLQINGNEIPLEENDRYQHGWHGLEAFPDGHRQRWSSARAALPADARVVIIDIVGPSFYLQHPEEVAVPCALASGIEPLSRMAAGKA